MSKLFFREFRTTVRTTDVNILTTETESTANRAIF